MAKLVDVPGQGVVEFPDNMSDEQIAQVLRGQPQQPMSRMEKLGRGLADPFEGGAQLLYNILPSGAQQAGNRINNWIADKTGMVARLPEGGLNQAVQESEKDYEARRAAAGESGIDGWRLAGNVFSPANLAVARALPGAATLLGRMGVGAAGGAVSSALMPTTGEEFWASKGGQVALGAGTGAAVPLVGAGLSRMVSPRASTDPAVQMLRQSGVRPTVGQTLGGTANKIEEKMMSIPFVGDAIGAARSRANADLNRAVADAALEPLGQKLPQGLTGREAVAHVQRTLSEAYDNLLPQMTVRADNQFGQQLNSLRAMVNTGSMDPRAANAFNTIVRNKVLSQFRGQNALTGETFKKIESNLTNEASRFLQSTDADQRLVGNALQEVQSALRQLAERSNPALRRELASINSGYAVFKRMERAASMIGAEEGSFTAAQLQNAVKALDRSKDKGRFARGEALLQDLSDAAKTRLGSKVPDSGTAGRLMIPAGIGGAAVYDPMLTGSAIGLGALAYSPPAQALLRGLVAARPQVAQPVARMIEQSSPVLAPAGGLLALEAFQ